MALSSTAPAGGRLNKVELIIIKPSLIMPGYIMFLKQNPAQMRPSAILHQDAEVLLRIDHHMKKMCFYTLDVHGTSMRHNIHAAGRYCITAYEMSVHYALTEDTHPDL